MNKLWREHSLSIIMGIGFVIFNIAFFMTEPGSHLYDFANMLAGCFGGGFILLMLAHKFWDKGSDPSTPPEE